MNFLEEILKMNPIANDPKLKELTQKLEFSEPQANIIMEALFPIAEGEGRGTDDL